MLLMKMYVRKKRDFLKYIELKSETEHVCKLFISVFCMDKSTSRWVKT